jgi:outer membrane protein assembly factor BamB
VICLNADTGTMIWEFFTNGIVFSSPAIADGKVYIGSMADHKVFCLNADNGKKIWEYTTGSYVDSSPAVADGKVYIGSWDGKVYCFSSSGGQPPEKPNKPSGLTKGKAGIEYTYTSSTTDPDGDQVYYLWDWGDGNNSGWLGPYNSGVTINTTYKWTVKGSYSIKAKVKDVYGLESPWSDPLPVTMPYTYKPILQFLELLFQRFPNAFPILQHLLGY